MYDLHYKRDAVTGRTQLMRIERTPTSSTTMGHRNIVGVEFTNATHQANLIFRSVRGDTTCADFALRNPGAFPLVQVRSFLESLDQGHERQARFIPSDEWNSLRHQVDEGYAITAYAVPDRRLGTASLVVSKEGKDGLDALVTSLTTFPGSAGRVVGELLEIACLNSLHKPDFSDGLVDAAQSLIDLVKHPDDVRQTWMAHFVRTLETYPSQQEAQAEAIDLAHTMLARLWDLPSKKARPRSSSEGLTRMSSTEGHV